MAPKPSDANEPDDGSTAFDPDEKKLPLPVADRVPPFLCKLYQIVHTPDTDHCIRWSPTRDSLLIVDQAQFAKQVLPLYFKHNSIRSFIRQLNTYGFRKRTRAEHVEFWNPAFQADRVDLLLHIKRVGAKHDGAGDDDVVAPTDTPIHKVELANVDVQVQELRRELKDMRALMQQYLQQLDFKIAMQTHLKRTMSAAAALRVPDSTSVLTSAGLGHDDAGGLSAGGLQLPGGADTSWNAYLHALGQGKQDVAPPPVQQVMKQAHEMHQHAQQVHAQQLQQLQQLHQLQQAQQQQLMMMQSQQQAQAIA